MKVTVENFQSIKSASILVEGLTLIVGPSNAGKSAIIRALEAALFNSPGTDFITTGKDYTKVTVENGNTIEYKKAKSTSYKLDGKEYSAIGRGQIQHISDLGFYGLDDASLSVKPQFSLQHDPPFLVSSYYPNSLISSIFSNLNGSIYLGKAKHINEKTLKICVAESNFSSKELATNSKILAQFKNWDKTSGQYKKTQEKIDLLKSASKYIPLIHTGEESIAKIKNNLSVINDKLKDLSALKTQEKINILEASQQKITLAKALKKLITAIKEFLSSAKELLTKSSVYTDSISKKKVQLEKITDYESIKKQQDIADMELHQLNSKIETIKEQLSQFKSCPLCGAEKEDLCVI